MTATNNDKNTAERARLFAAIMADARKAAPVWDAWGAKVSEVLDTIEALLEERAALEQVVFALRHRAQRTTMKYRGSMNGFQAECAKDFNACKRVIDARYTVHRGMIVTEAGVPKEVVNKLKQAVRERRAVQRQIRDVIEDSAAMQGRSPELRAEQPGYGVYLGVNTLPTPDKRAGTQFERDQTLPPHQRNQS